MFTELRRDVHRAATRRCSTSYPNLQTPEKAWSFDIKSIPAHIDGGSHVVISGPLLSFLGALLVGCITRAKGAINSTPPSGSSGVVYANCGNTFSSRPKMPSSTGRGQNSSSCAARSSDHAPVDTTSRSTSSDNEDGVPFPSHEQSPEEEQHLNSSCGEGAPSPVGGKDKFDYYHWVQNVDVTDCMAASILASPTWSKGRTFTCSTAGLVALYALLHPVFSMLLFRRPDVKEWLGGIYREQGEAHAAPGDRGASDREKENEQSREDTTTESATGELPPHGSLSSGVNPKYQVVMQQWTAKKSVRFLLEWFWDHERREIHMLCCCNPWCGKGTRGDCAQNALCRGRGDCELCQLQVGVRRTTTTASIPTDDPSSHGHTDT